MKQLKKRQLCTALAAAMGASMTLSLPVAAQLAAQTKERIEVTGSNIKRVDSEGPNPVDALDVRDRKSTRLNSSHQIISYAVFCLKKKNKTYTTRCSCACDSARQC